MIKRRRNPVPLVVDHKHRRSLLAPALQQSAPPRATPDRKIRAWNADDHKAREIEAFNRKSRGEQYEEMIEAWVASHRLANDPDTWRWVAEQEVARFVAETSMSHMQVIEGPDLRIVIRPKDRGLWSDLKRAFFTQYGKAKKVTTDPKAPKRMAWWHFIKDMRKSTDEHSSN